MTVTTRDFGVVEVQEDEILEFQQPIYGFEEYSRYILLQDKEVGLHFAWLQSVEDVATCFILVDPSAFLAEYHPAIPASVTKLLGEGDYICWCIVTVAERFRESTANLKSPVLINPLLRRGAQVILEDRYPIRQLLLESKEASV